jgi:hypothetical protein
MSMLPLTRTYSGIILPRLEPRLNRLYQGMLIAEKLGTGLLLIGLGLAWVPYRKRAKPGS